MSSCYCKVSRKQNSSSCNNKTNYLLKHISSAAIVTIIKYQSSDNQYFKNLIKTKILFDHNKLLLRRRLPLAHLGWKKD